jgi:hypothetical protein
LSLLITSAVPLRLSPTVASTSRPDSKKCEHHTYYIKFQVLTAASVTMTVFWEVAPWSVVEIGQHFGGTHCLHQDNGFGKHL